MKLTLILTIIMLIPFSQTSFGKKAGIRVTITGVVTDINQKPVKGAAIFIDNVKTGSVTNKAGFYKVKAEPDAREILAFSLTNGANKAEINGKTNINLTLTDKKIELPPDAGPNEELVNIGYGSVRKKDLTTSVSSLDGQHSQFVGYTNIYEMIRGRVPGVEVNGTNIVIRGISSLTLSSEPLFVVDGVIVPSIDGIDPQMVESIEVLKGAAASIYGTQGGNGVILINLLRGGEMKKKK
jgi:TonB-dependent SusC/RagA subfamily outer membrane receptor